MVSANQEMVVYCFDTLVTHYNGEQAPLPAFEDGQHPLFVTWKKAINGGEPRLRGCIGTLEARGLISGLKDYALTSHPSRPLALDPMARRNAASFLDRLRNSSTGTLLNLSKSFGGGSSGKVEYWSFYFLRASETEERSSGRDSLACVWGQIERKPPACIWKEPRVSSRVGLGLGQATMRDLHSFRSDQRD
ncbi:hypothetical protein M5K25_027094 [Dendrobium thyrsiflorum]|uniref:AMMECR1 domain-containing protein n=1 Tax=Dendrobium thyrsiflorum TaxID=117978 RepID=A0ABD0TZ37_DENTH